MSTVLIIEDEKNIVKAEMTSTTAGLVMLADKIIMLIALITFRIGWWGTIYCQQILLGMLTIFGPIQWAFSLLPRWEGAWAKWIIRYLTVHFYGAMLYFVGFYVLLLFDIVINIQYNDLAAVTASEEAMQGYLQNAFFRFFIVPILKRKNLVSVIQINSVEIFLFKMFLFPIIKRN